MKLQLFFHSRMIDSLKNCYNSRLTMVVAPYAYGKTAVFRYFEEEAIQRGHIVIWMDDLPGLEFLEGRLGQYPLEQELYVILDNQNPVDYKEQRVYASMQKRKNLHVICLLDLFPQEQCIMLMMDKRVNYISKLDLEFNVKDIVTLFLRNDMKISYREAIEIHHATDGWIGSILPVMQEYMVAGKILNVQHNKYLIERAFIQYLDASDLTLLFYFTEFPEFTIGQAEVILDTRDVKHLTQDILDPSPFVDYDQQQGCYRFQQVFARYLQVELQKQSWELQERVLLRSAKWYASKKLYLKAMRIYLKLGCFGEIYQLPFKLSDLTGQLGEEHLDLLIAVVKQCPKDIKLTNPKMLLMFANILAARGRAPEAQSFVQEVEQMLEQKEICDERMSEFLKGNIILFHTIMEYDQVEKLGSHYKEAYAYIKGPSDLLDRDYVWTYGSPFITAIYYSRSGGLGQIVNDVCALKEYYYRLTDGQGMGGDMVLMAEQLMNRGVLDEAEILAYRGIFLAESNKQHCIKVAGHMVLLNIGILSGDYKEAVIQSEQIKSCLHESENQNLMREVDLCRSYFFSVLSEYDEIPEWIRNFKESETFCPARLVPVVYVEYMKCLLLQRMDAKALAIGEYVLELTQKVHNVWGQIHVYLLMAIAYDRLGNSKAAASGVELAMELAMPDQMYLPFVHVYSALPAVFRRLEQRYLGEIREIERLSRLYIKGVNQCMQMRQNTERNQFGFTKREHEIAILAAKRLSNMEIAKELFISENTVKYNLKSIYSKAGVHSRYELEKLYQNQ